MWRDDLPHLWAHGTKIEDVGQLQATAISKQSKHLVKLVSNTKER